MTAALEVAGVIKRFGAVTAVDDVSFALTPGCLCGLIGPNGAGKTTLLDVLAGELRPDQGVVRLLGRDVTRAPAHARARAGLGRSFQITSVFPDRTVRENVRCALLQARGAGLGVWRDVTRDASLRRAEDEVLDTVGLTARADTPASALSYGEQRGLDMAIAVAPGAPVLLLDEPTAGMSLADTGSVIDTIRRIAEGRTVLIIEHDMNVVFSLSQRLLVLAEGRLVADGDPDSVAKDPRVQEAYFASSHA